MTIEQAVLILKAHIAWRDGSTYPEPRPINVREATMVLIEHTEKTISKGMGEK